MRRDVRADAAGVDLWIERDDGLLLLANEPRQRLGQTRVRGAHRLSLRNQLPRDRAARRARDRQRRHQQKQDQRRSEDDDDQSRAAFTLSSFHEDTPLPTAGMEVFSRTGRKRKRGSTPLCWYRYRERFRVLRHTIVTRRVSAIADSVKDAQKFIAGNGWIWKG